MMFSTTNLAAAVEHFLRHGCVIKKLPWAPEAAGFIARSPEGHAVCVVDESSLRDAEGIKRASSTRAETAARTLNARTAQ
ncbi:MAG: hypothetical protein M3P30_04170 [Chloroflexota bacterium]|nr:hypothetical protein [Chloroflexota bacterium]